MNKKLDENPYAILLEVSPETIQEAKENFDSLTETAQQALKHLNIKGPIFDIPASAYGCTEFHQALGCMEQIGRAHV